MEEIFLKRSFKLESIPKKLKFVKTFSKTKNTGLTFSLNLKLSTIKLKSCIDQFFIEMEKF